MIKPIEARLVGIGVPRIVLLPGIEAGPIDVVTVTNRSADIHIASGNVHAVSKVQVCSPTIGIRDGVDRSDDAASVPVVGGCVFSRKHAVGFRISPIDEAVVGSHRNLRIQARLLF